MNVTFRPVNSERDQEDLAVLAHDIWFEYWPALIGEAQTAYMVDKFQSLDAIKRDMATAGYEYWFIEVDDADNDASTDDANQESSKRRVGYTGGHVEPETNRFFISKIYLLKDERGHGYASKTIAFYRELCQQRGLRAAYLTVNKGNDLAIRAYRGKGFEVIDKVVTDIGSGFVMDDYIMELSV